MNNVYDDQNSILDKVEELVDLNSTPPPLPRMLLRGDRGYTTFEVLSPSGMNTCSWSNRDNAMKQIREWVPILNDTLFTTLFGKRNPRRQQCPRHLKSGSYNIKNLKVTRDIKRNISPDDDTVVIKAMSAPSQKLGSKELYSLRIVLISNKRMVFMNLFWHLRVIVDAQLGNSFVHIKVD